MSDWAPEPEPNPTLYLDFLWRDQPTAYCANCSEVVGMHARSHWGACNIIYKYVTTRAVDKRWMTMARDLRPDLTWLPEGAKPEGEAEFLKSLPIRQQFDWEMEPANGEGRGGGYLAHLRDKGYKLAVDPGDTRRTRTGFAMDFGDGVANSRLWKHAMFAKHYGHTYEQETPMDKNARLTVEIAAERWIDVVHALLDLAENNKIEITNVDETGAGAAVKDAVTEATESDPAAPVMVSRRYITGRDRIDAYLSRALDAKSRSGAEVPEMEITYVSALTDRRTIRKVRPRSVSWVSGSKLFLMDDVRAGALRTFYLDGIEAVEGPAI